MEIPFINLKAQYKDLYDEIHNRINQTLRHGQNILGPENYELEEKLSEFVGTKNCVTGGSGTDALMSSLMSIGLNQVT